jgi:hypothetical protein
MGNVIEPEDFIYLLDNLKTLDLSNVALYKNKTINALLVDNKVHLHFIHLFDDKIQERYLRRLKRFDINNILVPIRVYDETIFYGDEEKLHLYLLPEHMDRIVEICSKNNYKLLIFNSTSINYKQKYAENKLISVVDVDKDLPLDRTLSTH